jgi:Glyoxalase-like domain
MQGVRRITRSAASATRWPSEDEVYRAAGFNCPLRIEGAGQVVERTSDQIVAGIFGFYTEAFDVTVVISSPHWSEFTVAGTTIALHPGGSGDQTRTGLGFEVEDLDAALQRATEVGGRISAPQRERAGGADPSRRTRRHRRKSDHRCRGEGLTGLGVEDRANGRAGRSGRV